MSSNLPIGFEQQNTEAVNDPDAGLFPLHDKKLYPDTEKKDTLSGVLNPVGFESYSGDDLNKKKSSIELRSYKTFSEGDDIPEVVTPQQVTGSVPDSEILPLIGSTNPRQMQSKETDLYFRDKKRRIDYVLAYEEKMDGGTSSSNEKKQRHRLYYESSLERYGLELEHEDKGESVDKKTAFVKIHAPWEVLTKYAEIMNMKMPLAENDMDEITSIWDKCPSPFDLDPEIMKDDINYFTAPFNRKRMEQYIIESKETFFSSAQRSRIVHEILSRAEYNSDSKKAFGIRRLLGHVYTAAFPLHEGPHKSSHSISVCGKANDRHLLYETWARPLRWYKYQPLDHIRKYFGEKIGIYFCWLGFYTQMLIPAAVVGLVAFLYGLCTLASDIPSQEICEEKKSGMLIMCPLCDKRCTFWNLTQSCSYSRASYLFDNPATVAFAGFMALWSVFFHEFWIRKQKEIEYDWDVATFEDEEETIRPEFEASVKYKKKNPVNKTEEPYLPIWNKLLRYCATLVVLLFMLTLVIAAVVGVIVYRIIVVAIFYASSEDILRQRASVATTVTAAIINLVCILILNQVYQVLARALTNLEQHRTETNWEDAFTLKMFLFQFVNYYSTIFYIAFFKGRFHGSPNNYNYSLSERLEECDPAGCLIELCIQLGIIMVGKQAFNNFLEIIFPMLRNLFKSRSLKKKPDDDPSTQWEIDYCMAPMAALGLFTEYLEMVIQFGFVTIFVAAFPLAPFFALFNNIIEIRLDAYKFVTQWRRPLAVRAQDIGVWFGILKGISMLAVISNAFIIAFTSDFIPKLVYTMKTNSHGNLAGYVNFSLSVFNISDFSARSLPENYNASFQFCRYRDYREPPYSPNKYQYSIFYWHIIAARFGFVIVFENVLVMLAWLISYFIPDMPYHVKVQILRENFLAKEALLKAEMLSDELESMQRK